MIFVDTNVFMYAVGRPHALRKNAQEFFVEANRRSTPLCTSAEVMQELTHAYLPSERLQTFDAALGLIANAAVEVWPLEEADVALARRLHERHPALQARAFATWPVAADAASGRSRPSTRYWRRSPAIHLSGRGSMARGWWHWGWGYPRVPRGTRVFYMQA